MPRKRHVSRNKEDELYLFIDEVMPRKRHVSRNFAYKVFNSLAVGHASQEACE